MAFVAIARKPVFGKALTSKDALTLNAKRQTLNMFCYQH
jgi:hypothetical protein